MCTKFIKKLRHKYVVNQINCIELPEFENTPLVRKSIVFTGRVQKVGLRLATYKLAKRLGLTGWVRNRPDKRVEAEIQGELEKIIFLVDYLKSIKRAKIKSVEIDDMLISENEHSFTLVK